MQGVNEAAKNVCLFKENEKKKDAIAMEHNLTQDLSRMLKALTVW